MSAEAPRAVPSRSPRCGRRAAAAPAPATPARTAWRAFRRNRPAVAGLAVFLVLALGAALAPVLPVADPAAMSVRAPAQPPSGDHPLGTDSFGRDLLARVLWGGRISLAVAAATILLGGGVGTAAGLVAGYAGGAVDGVVMRLMDAIFTFPSILLAIALVGALGKGVENVVIALGVVYVPSFARQARAETRAVAAREFVQAATVLGASPARLLGRHVFPNVLGSLVVRASTFFAFSIIAESSLSFLGLGAQPPTPTWGGMLSEARPFLQREPWYPLVPGSVIVLAVLAVNLIGDGLVDALNPRHSRR